jgi:hypothetical protein
MIFDAICITLIENKTVYLYNNAYIDGYDRIVFKETDTGKKTTYQTSDSEVIIDLDTDYGDYEVYAINSDEDSTYSVKFAVYDETRNDLLEYCAKIANVNLKSKIIQRVVKSCVNNPSYNIISVMLNEMLSEGKEEFRLNLYNFIYTYTKLINRRCDLYNYNNDSNFSIDILKKQIHIENIDYIIQNNIGKNEPPHIYKYDIISGEDDGYTYKNISLNYNNMYQFKAYSDNQVVGVYYVFYPEESIINEVWTKSYESVCNINALIEKEIYYPAQYLDFNDYEKQLLSFLDKADDYSPLFKEPEISIDEYSVQVTINDYDKLKAIENLGYTFYIGFCMVDDINEENLVCDTVRISEESFYFDSRRYGMYDEDYFFYICDLDGVRYSNAVFVNKSDYVDEYFNERLRQLNIFNYNKHLAPLASNKSGDNASLITNAFQTCETDEYSTTNDIADNMLDIINTKMLQPDTLSNIVATIYQDKIVYGDYLVEFYNSPFYFKSKINTITLPPAEDTIYFIKKYSCGDSITTEYYNSSPDSAIDVKIYPTGIDTILIYGYNMKLKKQSGFMQINYDNLRKISLNKFLVEIEVI